MHSCHVGLEKYHWDLYNFEYSDGDDEHSYVLVDEATTLKVRGLFYGIGHQPNSHLFAEDIELDEGGYVKASPSVMDLQLISLGH